MQEVGTFAIGLAMLVLLPATAVYLDKRIGHLRHSTAAIAVLSIAASLAFGFGMLMIFSP
jgi:hypothetical protein